MKFAVVGPMYLSARAIGGDFTRGSAIFLVEGDLFDAEPGIEALI